MFGYVRVNNPDLKVRENEFYRGTYCGLCRSMGKCTGQCSRLSLSYDFVFLALIRISLIRESVSFGQGRCVAHPVRKRNYMKNNPSLEFCAGAAALLNYHKVMDDLSDEAGGKKLRALLARPFMAHARRKALRRGLTPLDEKISAGLLRLSSVEHDSAASVDTPAGIFGELLGDIVSYGLEGADARVAYSLGVAVGKWIYIADALDDWEDDAKKKRYNPFILLYGKPSPDGAELEGIKNALKNELYSAEAAIDLIDFENTDIKNIVLNILYLGMPERIDKIRFGETDAKGCKKDKASERMGNT